MAKDKNKKQQPAVPPAESKEAPPPRPDKPSPGKVSRFPGPGAVDGMTKTGMDLLRAEFNVSHLVDPDDVCRQAVAMIRSQRGALAKSVPVKSLTESQSPAAQLA